MTCYDHIIKENSNKLHGIIKNFSTYFPEEFERTNINMCGHCNGTGLSDFNQIFFCDNCGGTGYVGYEKIKKGYTCRSCNGSGCDICDYTGMVDWVLHATGRDIRKGP